MNTRTEILLTEELKQSNIETKIYDEFVQFYEYGAAVEDETFPENENRSGKRAFLTVGLAIIGGLFLFGGLAVGFYYLSEKIAQTETVNQLGVKTLPNDATNNNETGESKTIANGLEAEKIAKAKLSEDKNLSEAPFKKENPDPTETKTLKTVEPNDKDSLPSQMTKESPKTTDSSSKTPNSSKQFVPQDTKREFWTNSLSEKTVQNSPTSNQFEKDPVNRKRSEKFREQPKDRQELIVKKIKQSNLEQRSNIRERVQRQRGKN